jgi:hypothetical protein
LGPCCSLIQIKIEAVDRGQTAFSQDHKVVVKGFENVFAARNKHDLPAIKRAGLGFFHAKGPTDGSATGTEALLASMHATAKDLNFHRNLGPDGGIKGLPIRNLTFDKMNISSGTRG